LIRSLVVKARTMRFIASLATRLNLEQSLDSGQEQEE